MYDRVLDHLANIMFEADELLALLELGEAHSLSWAEPEVRQVYDRVNALMKRLSD